LYEEATVLTAGENFAHPMIAPPGVLAARIKLLHEAALVADIKKQEYDVRCGFR
jgi:hypothetical protein